MHMDTLRMQAVLGNYVKSKIYLEELLKGEGKHPISGIQEDIIHAVIGFFGAEEWELCSEACFYLRLLEEHLTKTGKNLQDCIKPYLKHHLELAKLLCRILQRIRENEKISEEDLERLGALSKGSYPVSSDLVREAFTTLRKHLKGRVPEEVLKELNIPPISKPSVVHSVTLDEQIATISAEFTTARIWAKALFSGGMDEASVGYYILLLTRNFSRAFELFFARGEEEGMRETWKFLEKLKKLSMERSLSLTEDPDVYHPLQTAEALHELWSFMEKSMPIPKNTLSRALSILSRETLPLRAKVLLRIRNYLESHSFEVPEELIEVLDKFPKPKEVDYWEEYQKTLREFDEKGRKFHEEAKKEWELVASGNAEDPIGSIQDIIWKLSEDIWLGKLRRVNLKWGNDIRWFEDYRVISNRIIRLTRIAEFMMWKRRIPEFLYANPYINLGGDYEENDFPLWALTRGLMMVLNHNRSKGVLPELSLQEEVLSYALRLNLLWPEKTEVWECKNGTCIVFKEGLNEKAIKELKKNIWDNDIVFYHGKDIVIGYSRKRRIGYICAKDKDKKETMRFLFLEK